MTTDKMNMPVIDHLDPIAEMARPESEAEALKAAYEDYKRLYGLSTVFYESHQISVVLDRVLEAFGEIVRFSGAALFLMDPATKEVQLSESRDLSPAAIRKLENFKAEGFLKWALKNDRIFLLPDKAMASKAATLFIPLVVNSLPLGILLIFVESGGEEISAKLMDQFTLLATQGAMAIANAKLYRDLQRKNRTVSEIRNFLTGILSNMADPLIVFNERQEIRVFNPAAEALFQLPLNRVIHKRYENVLPRALTTLFNKAFQLAQQGESFQEDDIPYLNNGHLIPLGIRASSIKSPSGAFGGVIISVRDLSEARELVNLRRIDQLKDEFMSSISHELRTPLTAIQSFTEILLDYNEDDPETRQEFLQVIQSQSHRLLTIIDNILMVAEINREGLSVSISQFSLPELIQEIIRLFQERVQEKSIELKILIQEGLSEITTDIRYIRQALVNIMDNAIKFSPKGGTIKIGATETPANTVQISVSDSGVGIPPDSTQIIFERFKQLGNTLTDKPDGTGLGLYIAKKLIEKIGGRIWVESEKGSGATFFIVLPLVRIQKGARNA
ncbi:MAG: PAS domain-containing protein [Calditrichaeota bacterium]|nr:PAS domain-containing protein [Calditrichota bacterium]